ncbi:MAG: aminomethyl transferase family protein, partial [Hyphomicrobiaceae bacterium]
ERQRSKDQVNIVAITDRQVGFALAGPRSRELLSRVVREDVSNKALPFLSLRTMDIGMVPARIGRISFTGELGYEIWCGMRWQRALMGSLREAGKDLGLKLFGGRALGSLRIEKGFGSWAREYRPIYGPEEAGLSRFLRQDGGEFIGRAAAEAAHKQGPERKLVLMSVETKDADAFGDEPIWHNGKVVGWVTSGSYGHTVKMSLVLGYVPAGIAAEKSGFEIEILGERFPAHILPAAAVDPKGERMRA